MTVSPFSTLCLTSALTSNPGIVVFMNCELVRGAEAQIVEELLPRVRQHSLALDLSGVERIDAAGIASLITLYCSAIEAGTEFSVVSPSAHVLELLQIVGLESILIADAKPRGEQRLSFGRSAA
jgi:anti-anti-sigma factor